MKIAALYDVHAMPLALEAVLAERTLELVRSLAASFVRGNCDREPTDWVRERLGREATAWAAGWPTTVEMDGVLYCHATPRDDMRPILTDASPQERFDEALVGIENRLIVAGHTHMQFRRGRFANAGSVGMPYEDDVAAFWAVVGDEVEFRRTPFDVERAIAEVAASGWPDAEAFVAENLCTPPSRREATEHFESLV